MSSTSDSESPPSNPSSQVDVEDIDEPGPSIQRPEQSQAAKKRTVARRGKCTSARRAAYKGKRPATRTRRSKTPALTNNSEKVLAKQKEGMKKQVSKLTKPQLQAAITRAIGMEPGLMLLVLSAPVPGGNPPRGAGPQPEEGNIIPSWCVCGNCRDMPTQRERICCGEEACLSHTADFDLLVLNEGVLALARLMRQDILVFFEEENLRRSNRHQAYRQFI